MYALIARKGASSIWKDFAITFSVYHIYSLSNTSQAYNVALNPRTAMEALLSGPKQVVVNDLKLTI